MFQCEGCGEPTKVLVIMLDEGDTTHLCMACFISYTITMAAAAEERFATETSA